MNSQISLTEIPWNKVVEYEAGSGSVQKKEKELFSHHKCLGCRENFGF